MTSMLRVIHETQFPWKERNIGIYNKNCTKQTDEYQPVRTIYICDFHVTNLKIIYYSTSVFTIFLTNRMMHPIKKAVKRKANSQTHIPVFIKLILTPTMELITPVAIA
ncbi:hypothetical protein M2463_000586 [Parabacteroides sp. PH5-13]|nr:hypothetical protein [Parabacteroides sp. PH5-13]MDH6325806.1 hypothetical protein [Parabacteroides sp. PH5-41]MDH6344671.1 hypothetical protein [Parabacteroides sp. PH5-46]MDH6383434.1 hypothetical protein [Parabacteroides sp. PH5-17]MDH6405899.1 hypothetical protein [Parabacteroides sp. PH5-26]